jgi:flagellar M-ring protein FliF
MDALRKLLTRLRDWVQSLPLGQRLVVVAAAGAGVLALGLFFYLQGKGDYGVLFSNLTQEDAGAIVSRLKGKKVPYLLENNGTTILVPKSEMYELRLLLAGEGLPKGGGVGFEIFDRQDLGVTDFVQRLNYQRALQGELARTIAGMPEVQEARVHIVTPKETLFLEEQKKPTASVAVKLRPGRTLSPAQVEGIVHLVASAVPGLHPGQVTVVDLQGRILSKPQDQLGLQGLSQGQLSLQRQVEESYERKLLDLFEKMLGTHKVLAQVSAELDFQKIDLQEESFTPNRELIRSEQKTEERSTRGLPGGNPEAGYDLGKGTITPPPPGKGPPPLTAPAPAKSTSGVSTERLSEVRNYEINRVVRHVVETPGKIKRLSVALVVDGIYKGKGKAFTPRSPEEMRQFANLAKKAVGFNAERGDQLEINCAPLAMQVTEGTTALSSDKSWMQEYGFSWKIGLLILLALGVMMFFLKQRRLPHRPPLLEPPSERALEGVRTSETPLPERLAPTALEASPPPPSLPEPVSGQERVAHLISSHPDRAVEVLRLWLHEKERK